MLSIIIADDHPIIRVGLGFLVKENFDNPIVSMAKDGDEIIELVKHKDVNIILMDLNMPGTDPQRVLQTITALKPGIGIIIFSMNKEEIFGLMYLKLGAMAYLRKGCEEQEIVKAIKCVLDGNVYITKEMQPFYLGKNAALNQGNPFATLSKKELEVLRHLAKGDSVIKISKIMNISSSTVGTHKANILEKLKIENMFELKELVQIYPLE